MASEFIGFLDYNGARYEISGSDAEKLIDQLNGYHEDDAMFRFVPVNADPDTSHVYVHLGPGVPLTFTWKRNPNH